MFPQIVFSRSDDTGQTFGSRVLVSDISAGSLFPPAGYNRNTTNDFPRIAVDNTKGKFKDRIYIVYQDSRIANGGPMPAPIGPEDEEAAALLDIEPQDFGHPDTDIFLRFSDDGGNTWSDPILVAGAGDGKIQFWPVVSVQPDGTVDVTWYESEEPEGTTFLGGLDGAPGPGTSLVDVFYAGSVNGGRTFSKPLRVTEVTTDWAATQTNIRPNFGDYIFHVSTADRVLTTWADGRNAVPDVFYATITSGQVKQGAPLADSPALPEAFALNQNYPNPFNPETEITFALPRESYVSVKIYDLLGREVAVLTEGKRPAGEHRISFDAKNLPSGVYVYTLTATDFVSSKKMVVLK